MEREEFLESLIRRVRDAKSLEDIEAIFKDAYGLDDGFLNFAKTLAAIQNGAQPAYTKELSQYFESLDTQTAIEQVGEYFSATFPAWRENPQGNLPLLVLPEKEMAEIGANSKIGLLSSYTIGKQKIHHPELDIHDYERAQEIVSNGCRFKQKEHHFAYFDDKKDLMIIIKPTVDGNEVYVQSLYRLSTKPNWRESEIRRVIKGKKGQ